MTAAGEEKQKENEGGVNARSAQKEKHLL